MLEPELDGWDLPFLGLVDKPKETDFQEPERDDDYVPFPGEKEETYD